MDNLERDVREAQRLGYGCHYDLYKADHPHTGNYTVDLPPEEPNEFIRNRSCKRCGKEFEPDHGSQLYCSDACRREAALSRNRESKRRTVSQRKLRSPCAPGVCPICGISFLRDRESHTFCSRSCAAKSRNMKRNGSAAQQITAAGS